MREFFLFKKKKKDSYSATKFNDYVLLAYLFKITAQYAKHLKNQNYINLQELKKTCGMWQLSSNTTGQLS